VHETVILRAEIDEAPVFLDAFLWFFGKRGGAFRNERARACVETTYGSAV